MLNTGSFFAQKGYLSKAAESVLTVGLLGYAINSNFRAREQDLHPVPIKVFVSLKLEAY